MRQKGLLFVTVCFLQANPKNPHRTKNKWKKKTVQQVVQVPSEGRLKKKPENRKKSK
jgi:predicted metal-binding protein